MKMSEWLKSLITTIANLFKIKSVVTLMLTGLFCWATVYAMENSTAVPAELTDTFKMIVIFYFGTQVGKASKGE